MRLWFETALLPGGWADHVAIRLAPDGTIAAIDIGAPPAGSANLGAAIPGLANVHSHAFQRGMAGLAEFRGNPDDDFWSWREIMYRFLDRLDPNDVEAIAALAYIEMLESGFTRVGEFHYLHHQPDGTPYANLAELAERIAAAAEQTGIGLTLLPVAYRHAGFGRRPPERGHIRFLNDPARFARLFEASRHAIAALPDANIGVAPHSLRAVDHVELGDILTLAPAGPIHIHAAEQIREVEDCIAALGARPVAWLIDNLPVDERWCLIHATHLDPREIARLAASGAVAGLCPLTEANLGDGIFPMPAYLEAGGRFGIGTDSNIAIDAARELEMIEYAQRLTHRRRNLLATPDQPSTGTRLFAAALAGSARALGQPHPALEVGAPADIVALDMGSASLLGRRTDQLLDSWIFSGSRDAVHHVWRRGRHVVVARRHVARGSAEARYRKTMEKLLGR
ncbi:formimidoylglutamate deiminase [Sphingosinicella microcystinivorans]|uniref:Formimidoylglutamate deiminase n=1 Tax=Sphingosinicella microcystinivorans TaxID=335406 RepID=A0ABX9SUG8_SPHMI|nr:formimidoylglutamate deiminase [Sphingosinicella microcystinivorans]RKS84560.1 formimidoylglutamate deiminase [Sphingosinicella microcystinivorans]